MDRRALLASLAAGGSLLAGCSTRFGTGTEDTGTPTVTPAPVGTETPTKEPNGNADADGDGDWSLASVVDLQTVSRTYALGPTGYHSDDGARVELGFTSTATPDSPAMVTGSLTNAASWSNTFRLRETPPFGQTNRTGGIRDYDRDLTYRSNLVFAPTETNAVADTVPDLELADDRTWRLAEPISDTWGPETLRLDGEETVEAEWYLVGQPEGVDEGRPTGTYEFRSGDTDLAVTVWDTAHPGPDGATDPLDGPDVSPGPLPHSDETDWYFEATPATPAYLEPSMRRLSLPGAVDLTLTNHTHGTLSGNSWNLYKRRDGEWFYLEPWAHTAVLRMIAPGEEREYQLRAFHGDPVPCDGISVANLGGGTYAFESMYGTDEDAPVDLGHFAALLDVEAPPVEIRPTRDADLSVERDGATVHVEWPRRPEVERGSLTVERHEDTPPERLLPEQVMRARNRGLRNTLAFFEDGVDRVVLRTDRNTVSTAGGAEGYTPVSRLFTLYGEAGTQGYVATATFGE
jgi:hypothetical protein